MPCAEPISPQQQALDRAVLRNNADAARILCEALKNARRPRRRFAQVDTLSDEVEQWWAEHQRLDALRERGPR